MLLLLNKLIFEQILKS